MESNKLIKIPKNDSKKKVMLLRTIVLIVKNTIKEHEKNGIIFDGYPRTVEQAEFLETITKIEAIVDIVISDEESIKRITSRRVCPKCGKNYNVITLPPKVAGKCDVDNEPLIQRKDDTEEAVKKRLAAYHEKTEPLIKFYKDKQVLMHIINGEQSIEQVFADIKKVLK